VCSNSCTRSKHRSNEAEMGMETRKPGLIEDQR
jgi:hypothetical protein